MWFLRKKRIKVGRTKIIIHWRAKNKDRRTDILSIVKDWIKEDKRIRRFRKIIVVIKEGKKGHVGGKFKPTHFKKLGYHLYLYLNTLTKLDPVEALKHELLHNEQYKHKQYNSYQQHLRAKENLEESENNILAGARRVLELMDEMLALVSFDVDESYKELYKQSLNATKFSIKQDRETDHRTIDFAIIVLHFFLVKLSMEGQATFCEKKHTWDKGFLDKQHEKSEHLLKQLMTGLNAGSDSIGESMDVRKEQLAHLRIFVSKKASAHEKFRLLSVLNKASKGYKLAKKEMTKGVRATLKFFSPGAYEIGEYMTYTILYAFDKLTLEDLIKKDAFKFVRLYERACKKLDLNPLVSLGDTSAIYCHKQQLKKWRVLIKRKRRILRVAKR